MLDVVKKMLMALHDGSIAFDRLGWQYIYSDQTPRQANDDDCGVFVCKGMEEVAKGIAPPFSFTQSSIPSFRKEMIARLSPFVD